jgi:Mrp family chromosome partitioning ATPase
MKVFSDGNNQGIQKETTNDQTSIDKVIAIMSGKGGVGKSTVTSLLASSLSLQGKKVGILDADITGPSIPKLFGLNEESARGTEDGIFPIEKDGLKIMSINFLLEDKESPVIWRGPIVSSTVKQFYTDVFWGELDYLLIDLPPGTGDVALTIMQSLPIDGIGIVTSPQDLVNHIVVKSLNMANQLNVPVIGLFENMSYYECNHCGEKTHIFGESQVASVAEANNIDVIAELPIDPKMVEFSNKGEINNYLDHNQDFANYFIDRTNKVL